MTKIARYCSLFLLVLLSGMILGCNKPQPTEEPTPPPATTTEEKQPVTTGQEKKMTSESKAESPEIQAARKLGTPTDAPVVKTDSGLQYIIVKAGTGNSPHLGDMTEVHYTGWLVNGTKFDSSRDRGTPFAFPVGTGQVIKGWDEGVIDMKPGEVRKLIVPADLGYGSRGAGAVIPPNSTLIFEVEFLRVK